MRVNVGCGKMVLEGWVNCDVQVSPKAKRPPEILCDAKTIPLDDGVADEVMALHLIEHFYLWEVGEVLAEWRRLLRPNGKLSLELPNLEAACRNLLKGGPNVEQMAMWPFYGDPSHTDPYMCHRWGYTPKTIAELLKAYGFYDVRVGPPTMHGKRKNRDMRVEARKA